MNSYLLILTLLLPGFQVSSVEAIKVNSQESCNSIGKRWVNKIKSQSRHIDKGVFYTCDKL